MNRSRISITIPSLLLIACVGLTACSRTAPPADTAVDPANTATGQRLDTAAGIDAEPASEANSSAAPSADGTLADGRHPARITHVDAEGRQVTIDVVQFFLGDAASEAARQDNAPEVPPPNDYWIRNVNPGLRSLAVHADAPVAVNTLTLDQTGSLRNSNISLAQLAAYDDDRVSLSLFWVTTRSGAVTEIAEQFLP